MIKYDLHGFCARYGLQNTQTYKIICKGLKPGVWVAGGALRDMIEGKDIRSDIDYFATSEAALKSQIPPNNNSKQNAHNISVVLDGLKHQFITINYYENAKKLLDSFDFTICQLATDGNFLYCGDYTLFDIARHRLQVHKITYAVASMRRLIKYCSYSYRACDGCLLALLNASEESKNSNVFYVD